MPLHDVLIIGGGPSGYEAAIRLNQYGIDCAVLESARIGGICLNWGCIPTKALVRSAELYHEFRDAGSYGLPALAGQADYQKVFERKNSVVEQLVGGIEFLFRKRGIPILSERAVAVARTDQGYVVETAGNTRIEARHLIVATGSLPKELPGVSIDEERILSSTGLLKLDRLPKSLAVVGGGVVGCEFASIFNAFGVPTQIIEFLPRILATEDEELTKRLTLALKKSGIKITTGVGVQSSQAVTEGTELLLSDGSSLTAEKVLLSVGRAPQHDLCWQDLQIETEKGIIKIDDTMRTNLPGVYAIGDVTGKLPLAHTAAKQGLIAASHIRHSLRGGEFNLPPLNYANIPRCTFTSPELASVGLTEQEAQDRYGGIQVGRFPFSANGKALALGNSFGFVKTVARASDSVLVGMHILGPQAAELIAQGALLIALEAPANVVERVVWAHPTLSEAVMESLEDLHKLSIHKI